MKNLLLIIIFSTTYFVGFSQKLEKVRFEKAKALPIGLFGMAYSANNKSIFVVGGSSTPNPYPVALYMYDTLLNAWLNLSRSAALKPVCYGRAVYLEGFESIVLLGGTTPYGSSEILAPDLISYNLATYKTKALGQNPMPSKLPGAAYWQGKVYMFGGSTFLKAKLTGKLVQEFTRQMYTYDPEIGTMEVLPDLPEAKETNGGIIDGKLYTFGGFNNQPNREVHVYDIENASWYKIGSFRPSGFSLRTGTL